MPHRLTMHNGIPEHGKLCNCLDCRTAWEPRHDSDRLALEEIELRQAKPATDAEWAEFMAAEFPRAKEGVNA